MDMMTAKVVTVNLEAKDERFTVGAQALRAYTREKNLDVGPWASRSECQEALAQHDAAVAVEMVNQPDSGVELYADALVLVGRTHPSFPNPKCIDAKPSGRKATRWLRRLERKQARREQRA